MKKIIMMALGAGLLLGACSKDYLDLSSTRYISKSDIDRISLESPHLMEATLNGLYAYNVRVESGGTDGHDDFGQKGYDLYSDILSGDLNLNGVRYGWYRGIANFQNISNFAALENYKPWRFYYYMVRGTNNVLEPYNGKDFSTLDNESKKVVAEAKALRAYMYYNLMVLYTKGYDANEKILPIYDLPILKNLPSKKTQEVFDFMIKDLEESLKLFEEAGLTSGGKNVNYNVARGIASYVYAAKGDAASLQRVVELTNGVIANGGYKLAGEKELLGGFNKVASNPNWMWGAVLTSENGLDLVSWWGQVDVFTYSYASVGDTKGMNKELYESIKDEDIRKKQYEVSFSKANFGEETYLPVGKFYSALGKRLQGQRIVESDYVFMRVEEMYLLNAEANARLGQDAAAKDILKDFLANRIDDTTFVDALSGKALKDEVLHQIQIELWGEGKSYAAIKRNKAEFKYSSKNLYNKNAVFSYDDVKLTFKVPQSEILNNTVYND